MTQDELARKLELLLRAKKLIDELRVEGLLKDSYHPIWKSAVKAAEKRLKNGKLSND